MRNINLDKKRGFTLLELIIGMVILVTAIVSLIAAYIGCFTLNQSARNLTIAINDGQTVMEEIRKTNIPDSITSQDWTTWASTNPPDGGGCNRLENESITVTYPSGIAATPLQVLVTVNWKEKNRTRSTQLVTLISER